MENVPKISSAKIYQCMNIVRREKDKETIKTLKIGIFEFYFSSLTPY